MAITTSGVYWLTLEKFLNGNASTSWESTSCKYALNLDTDTPNFDADEDRADISEHAATGNYTAGGNALVAPALTVSSGMKHDFNDPQWTSSTITDAMAGVVCSGDASAALDEVYYLHDFVTAVSTVSGTLDVAIHANGALTFA